jgi:CRISPR-associated endoribonuclease Cas6
MRFQLNLKVDSHVFGNRLPINYQYELSAWIYRIIAQGDRDYAEWLHQNGFSDKHRNFRLFVFSNLYSPNIKFENDLLIFQSYKASFFLSLLPEKSTEAFIKGIFKEQDFSLGDRISKVHFTVQQVELIPAPDFAVHSVFKTLSPVVVSVGQENSPHARYISPDEEGYGQLIINNLKEKYRLYYQNELTGDPNFRFELLSPARSKLIRIKAATKEQTQVRGFAFTFRLEADRELLKVMYEAGMGEKNAQGFGCVQTAERSVIERGR